MMDNFTNSLEKYKVRLFFINWTFENLMEQDYKAQIFIHPKCTLELNLRREKDYDSLSFFVSKIKLDVSLNIRKVHFEVSVLDSKDNVLERIFNHCFQRNETEDGQEIITEAVLRKLNPETPIIGNILMRSEICIEVNYPLADLQNPPHQCSILSQNMKQILTEEGNFADINVNICGKIIKLHRALLLYRCPSLLSFLKEQAVTKHQTCNWMHSESKQALYCLEDVDYNVFSFITNYLYSGNTYETECETGPSFWFDVYEFANKIDLTKLCEQLAPTTVEISTQSCLTTKYNLIWPLKNLDLAGECKTLWSPCCKFIFNGKSFLWNLGLLLLNDFRMIIQIKYENPSSALDVPHRGRCTIYVTNKRKNQEIKLDSSSFFTCNERDVGPEPLIFDFSSYKTLTQSSIFDFTIKCEVEIHPNNSEHTSYKVGTYISVPPENTFPGALSHDLGSLLETGELSDFQIKADSKIFRVHRFVLSARSSMFFQLLKSREQDGIIIEGKGDDTVENLIHYIYTGYISDAKKLDHNLCDTAIYFKLPDLENKCRQQIEQKRFVYQSGYIHSKTKS